MPAFALPLALLALAALAIPLLVHLARRQTLVPTVFAALRWLRPRARPRRQVRLDEWPLLLLRLLLLTLFALWLAQPVLQREAPPARWTMLAPGLDPQALPAPAEGETRRWLSPGWPVVGDGPAPAADAAGPGVFGIGTLLRQLDMTLPAEASLVVYVPDPLAGADAQRPRLSREVDWRVLQVAAGGIGDDGGNSDSGNHGSSGGAGGEGDGGERDGAPGVWSAAVAPPQLVIRHDAGHAAGVRYLRAAAHAWQAGTAATRTPEGARDASGTGPAARGTQAAGRAGAIESAEARAGDDVVDVAEVDPADVDAGARAVARADVGRDGDAGASAEDAGVDPARPPTTTVLAWLVAGQVPDAVRTFVAEGGTVLLSADADWPGLEDAPPAWDGESAVRATAMRHGRGRVVGLAQPLDPAIWPGLLDPGFPYALRRVLLAPPAPARVAAADYAPVAGAPAWPVAWQDLRAPLLWLILLVLLAERWLATSRRRGEAP